MNPSKYILALLFLLNGFTSQAQLYIGNGTTLSQTLKAQVSKINELEKMMAIIQAQLDDANRANVSETVETEK